LDVFLDWIMKSFPDKTVEKSVVDYGLRDFFGNRKNTDLFTDTANVGKHNGVTLNDLDLFLLLFGPIKKFQQKIFQVYKEPYAINDLP
jgi:hypothetical protein